MIVYRWEHEHRGHGPLCGKGDQSWSWFEIFKEHLSPNQFDVFNEYQREHANIDTQEHFFAWDCLDKLVGNIQDGKESSLEEAGYVLTAWEVKESFCHMPDGQVFFYKELATRIS